MEKKICFVIANRANYGRIRPVLLQLKKNKKIKLQIVLTASSVLNKFGDLSKILNKDGFYNFKKCHVILEGANPLTMAKSTGLSVIELSTVFDILKPSIVVTTGDRFETLATAIAASYMNIGLAHIQGGEITGSIDESVRHAVTKLSHIHFAATKKAKENLIRMGEDPKYVFNTGCPSIDIIKNSKKKLKDIKSLSHGVGNIFNYNKPFVLVVFHPVTTEFLKIEDQINIFSNAINSIDNQIIWLWPNIDAGTDIISKTLRRYREEGKFKNVSFFKNFEVDDYIVLLKNTICAVGNSSSFIREGSYLKMPTVIVGNRQNKREVGNNIVFSKVNKNEIISKIKSQIQNKNKIRKSNIYGDGNSAKKISSLLSNIKPKIQKTLNY